MQNAIRREVVSNSKPNVAVIPSDIRWLRSPHVYPLENHMEPS